MDKTKLLGIIIGSIISSCLIILSVLKILLYEENKEDRKRKMQDINTRTENLKKRESNINSEIEGLKTDSYATRLKSYLYTPANIKKEEELLREKQKIREEMDKLRSKRKKYGMPNVSNSSNNIIDISNIDKSDINNKIDELFKIDGGTYHIPYYTSINLPKGLKEINNKGGLFPDKIKENIDKFKNRKWIDEINKKVVGTPENIRNTDIMGKYKEMLLEHIYFLIILSMNNNDKVIQEDIKLLSQEIWGFVFEVYDNYEDNDKKYVQEITGEVWKDVWNPEKYKEDMVKSLSGTTGWGTRGFINIKINGYKGREANAQKITIKSDNFTGGRRNKYKTNKKVKRKTRKNKK